MFAQVTKELNGIIPEFAQVRERAYERFSQLGFPTSKDEDWKYTSVQLLKGKSYAPKLTASGIALEQLEQFVVPDPAVARVVFVDGHYSPGLSSFKAGGKIEVQPLRSLLGAPSAGTRSHEILLAHLGRYAAFDDSSFTALNTALFLDGAFVHVREGGMIEQPLQLLYLSTGSSQSSFVPVRNLIVAEAGSSLQVVESYIGLGGQRSDSDHYFTSAVTEVVCREDSVVEHTKIQREAHFAAHIARLHVHQAARSTFTSNVFNFGGKLVRNEIHPVLDGERIECFLNGLSVIGGEQHTDNTTIIDHAKPNCFSRELYKGIYGGKSSGVFSGTIIVRQDAQKTNAIQSNNSLLLTGDATIDTRPQLKIWADDVKCTHGATVGQLDEDALFYMRSRGIEERLARALLIHAFASDIVNHVSRKTIRDFIELQLIERLREELGVTEE